MLVEIESKGKVRIMRMQNGKDNRFNPDFVEALNQALDGIEADGGARAVVITGAQEKYFSNGIDVEWMLKAGPESMKIFFPTFLRLLARILTYPKPVVAAINGHVTAGGLFFAMTADYRVMRADRGWVFANEIDLQFRLVKGLLALNIDTVGKRNAEIIILSGERFSPEGALKMGIVDQLAAKDELLDKAIQRAELLGSKPAQTYADSKLDFREQTAAKLLHDAENYVVPADQ